MTEYLDACNYGNGLALHRPGPTPPAERTPLVTHFHEAAVWTGATVHEFAGWLHARRQIITASRMAALLGCDPRQDALDVYVDMVKPLEEELTRSDDEQLDDPRLWGRVLEEPIARTVAKVLDWDIVMGGALLVSRKYAHIGATLDAEIRPRSEIDWFVYEGKTVDVFRRRDWDEEAGLPPDHILIQAQTQLLVTQAPQAIVFALVGGNRPVRIPVHPDQELHAVMVEAVEEFLDQVRRLDPPPPTMRSENALKRLYPHENGERIQLSSEELEWTAELQQLAKERRACEKREAEIKNWIRASMGEASFGELPEETGGKQLWKWVTEHRSERPPVPASNSRVLRLVKGDQKKREGTTTTNTARPKRRRARRA
jgi:predicted phage-related endonuclease